MGWLQALKHARFCDLLISLFETPQQVRRWGRFFLWFHLADNIYVYVMLMLCTASSASNAQCS